MASHNHGELGGGRNATEGQPLCLVADVLVREARRRTMPSPGGGSARSASSALNLFRAGGKATFANHGFSSVPPCLRVLRGQAQRCSVDLEDASKVEPQAARQGRQGWFRALRRWMGVAPGLRPRPRLRCSPSSGQPWVAVGSMCPVCPAAVPERSCARRRGRASLAPSGPPRTVARTGRKRRRSADHAVPWCLGAHAAADDPRRRLKPSRCGTPRPAPWSCPRRSAAAAPRSRTTSTCRRTRR